MRQGDVFRLYICTFRRAERPGARERVFLWLEVGFWGHSCQFRNENPVHTAFVQVCEILYGSCGPGACLTSVRIFVQFAATGAFSKPFGHPYERRRWKSH